MSGHVRERGKGNWYAVLSVRDPQTGKRKVRFVSLPGAKGKREAQQECARIVTEMQKGSYVEPDKTSLAQSLSGGWDKSKRRCRRAPMSDMPRLCTTILSPR